MYQNLPSNISKSRRHTSSIFMSFSIKSGTRNSITEWKPEPEVVFGAILAKNQISGFLCLVSRWYVYVRRRRDRPIDRSTVDALDRRCGPETELLRTGEPTPITLSVCGDLTAGKRTRILASREHRVFLKTNYKYM